MKKQIKPTLYKAHGKWLCAILHVPHRARGIIGYADTFMNAYGNWYYKMNTLPPSYWEGILDYNYNFAPYKPPVL